MGYSRFDSKNDSIFDGRIDTIFGVKSGKSYLNRGQNFIFNGMSFMQE